MTLMTRDVWFGWLLCCIYFYPWLWEVGFNKSTNPLSFNNTTIPLFWRLFNTDSTNSSNWHVGWFRLCTFRSKLPIHHLASGKLPLIIRHQLLCSSLKNSWQYNIEQIFTFSILFPMTRSDIASTPLHHHQRYICIK